MQELGASFKVGDIPADLMDEAQEWREKLLEQVVEMDDDAMEKYLDVCACSPPLPPPPTSPCPMPCWLFPWHVFSAKKRKVPLHH